MEYSSSRERRRAAAASRRAARSIGDIDNTHDNNNNTTDEEPLHQQHNYSSRIKSNKSPSRNYSKQQRQPLEKSFLSSLSRAFTNIDRHNNDYFTSSSDTAASNNNTNCHQDHDNIASPYNNKHHHTTTKRLKQPRPPTNLTSYISFTTISIYLLLLFTSTYLLLLFCTLPMLISTDTPLPTDDDVGITQHVHKGASFQSIRGRRQYQQMKEQLGTLKERAVQWEESAKDAARQEAVELQEKERSLLDKLSSIGSGSSREDVMKVGMLLEEVVEEFEGEVEEHHQAGLAADKGHDEHWTDSLKAWNQAVGSDTHDDENDVENNNNEMENNGNVGNENKRPGFIVLGMHRSGTSMLSGLLVEGFGYETGGPLIMPNFDNEKGFYERIDVVLQNDEFFDAQDIGWSYNVINYDSEQAIRDKLQGRIDFDEGKRALKFLNNHLKTLPYLQKDPRMCIALPTWLKLLDDEPAIVFTYRHPLEVAMSLKKRDSSFYLEHGLRLWIVYNMRAIQNSARLCRVFSTNEAVMKDPAKEVQRIKNQLTDKCNVIPPPKSLIPQKVVDSFIDPNLQHNSKERKNEEKTSGIMKDFGDGCVAREFDSENERGSPEYESEKEMFLMAMQVFCDFENGKAYEDGYEWPDLEHWQRPASIN